MAGIRGKDTAPEFLVRRALHRRGFRYRLHVGSLPGRPDIVLPKYCAVVFVHGCFWHGHGCRLFKWPKTRQEFWQQKISRNQANDLRHMASLQRDGWRVAVVWECALRGAEHVIRDNLVTLSDWVASGYEILELKGPHDECEKRDDRG